MSAKALYDTAPLGALVRYSNGQPQLPARFTRKLRAWQGENGVGRLIGKTPSARYGDYVSPASFTLHIGDYGFQAVVVIVLHRTYGVDSPLAFEVIESPPAGAVLCLTPFGDGHELKFLASDRAAARAWHASQGRYSDPSYREVQPDGAHLDIALEALAA